MPSVPVAVVQIGQVGVAVGQRRMLVGVQMRLAAVPREVMHMLVVGVVPVRVRMRELVLVRVGVCSG